MWQWGRGGVGCVYTRVWSVVCVLCFWAPSESHVVACVGRTLQGWWWDPQGLICLHQEPCSLLPQPPEARHPSPRTVCLDRRAACRGLAGLSVGGRPAEALGFCPGEHDVHCDRPRGDARSRGSTATGTRGGAGAL